MQGTLLGAAAFISTFGCFMSDLFSVQDHLQGEQPASGSLEDEAVVRQRIRSLHRAVEGAAAEMARREAVRRRPAGSLLFDDALYDAPRPQTYAEGVCNTWRQQISDAAAVSGMRPKHLKRDCCLVQIIVTCTLAGHPRKDQVLYEAISWTNLTGKMG